MEVFLDLAGDAVLAFVNAIEEVHPGVDGHGDRVELDSVDEGHGGSIDAASRGVLPEGTGVAISVVLIATLVTTVDIVLIEAKFSRDHLGPVGSKVILRHICHAKDRGLVLECKVLVLLAVASSTSVAEIHKIRHKLGYLV